VVDADEVVEVFARAAVEQIADEVETALPGFVAAFVDVGLDVGVLGRLVWFWSSLGCS
jgi:hypothetical protein